MVNNLAKIIAQSLVDGRQKYRVGMSVVISGKTLYQSELTFVDEIHRFNKAQQDAFLPHVEKGTITLLGATTENPSFEINAPLLSRARVFHFRELNSFDIKKLIKKALKEINKNPDKHFPKIFKNKTINIKITKISGLYC